MRKTRTRRPKMMADATKPIIDEIIKDAKEEVLNQLEYQYAWSMERCESPIERLFAAAMVTPSTTDEYMTRIDLLAPRSGLIEDCQAPPPAAIYMWQQIKIGDYRVDFLFEAVPGDGHKLIVEVDGHDFHEKTKEQAQRDKARDRYLVSRGFRVVRFTGSEIFRDPFECAHEALQILMGIRS